MNQIIYEWEFWTMKSGSKILEKLPPRRILELIKICDNLSENWRMNYMNASKFMEKIEWMYIQHFYLSPASTQYLPSLRNICENYEYE